MVTALAAVCASLAAREREVDAWLRAELGRQPVPFYFSTDLRVSAHKVVSVDANLFPGGFNNLPQAALPVARRAAEAWFRRNHPAARKVALVVERLTRNPYYAVHLDFLREIVQAGCAEVRLAVLGGEPLVLEGHHRRVAAGVLRREGDRLAVDGFEPDLVLLNNDLTAEVPAILEGAAAKVVPPLAAGWAQRRKSGHFFHYERVTDDFARAFAVDPWVLRAYFNVCHKVDISKQVGLDCLAEAVNETWLDIQANFGRVGSAERPFVVLKADAGTYGMGVVMLGDPEGARNLNRRQRKSLSVIKDGAAVRDILIQEGVPTACRVEGLVAEPVYYFIGTELVGGFWRLNQGHDEYSNLNSRGMSFWPMNPGHQDRNLATVQRVVASLGLLATARELAA